ncbi:N-acetyl-1-D-myo-inositol-2-amino-2-deoxy-alpha-D-glucopyranoside deacetylase [Streptosporangium sp. NBC_01639]|uniref:N-acetyl-1-D-myo-inositol-2-amino-2-deoxy-alpha- D-glucopyranoside deacetylase n=1 Tax=unclassified Streptosporangium TaxID=2632669 RepID=UPI002DD7B631|nr:N-acetyl-1-D-myo-inositol-2-amino-2-deoxy-alpha-D-glucopyranoside deacetylase [Streptosporangium sp. NBC_01756]WSC89233.1 N-acetyl-1-D-myo-inositol-2-amino-2-deoxy-alpha-D-glucopyranoside deacetylase [Streptosporangium sp. NBC_01756]WTD52096.1 N-acetyl-1-D-myo-inositol-2-amino-2-deoxy-alpha-D-glucopyranoside deacetylase [Streptosporangium sp. NBC_01639]
MTDRRLLLVHAHPDDETIGSGATMAKYAAEGAHVTLVTCTLGEEGEVIPPELAHLAADRDDALGGHRIGELAAACAALGVTDHRFLGGPGRWRDSGMMGVASNHRDNAFWQADLDEAAGELVKVIREVRPQVLVTYDENGFYGHPDHIQAHRVARRAFELAADPAFGAGEPWRIAKFYLTATARSTMRRTAEAIREAGVRFLTEDVEDVPFGCADEDITTEIDGRAHVGRKLDAMRAHATQISVDPPWFALSNNVGQEALAVEHFILDSGVPGPAEPGAPAEAGGLGEPYKREADLFAGIH